MVKKVEGELAIENIQPTPMSDLKPSVYTEVVFGKLTTKNCVNSIGIKETRRN